MRPCTSSSRGFWIRRRRTNFFRTFIPVAEEIARLGAINSLAQTVLKLTAPGVPDIYQGNEIWDFSLVDPDNRRPVDYDLRRKMLCGLKNATAQELLGNWPDGRIKLLRHAAVAASAARTSGVVPARQLTFRSNRQERLRIGRRVYARERGTIAARPRDTAFVAGRVSADRRAMAGHRGAIA